MNEISLITPTFNAKKFLTTFLDNVAEQTLRVQHIIVDGGSTDSTLESLHRCSNKYLKFISEPDQGPYDAMNKGISIATGDVIGILNADDFYADIGVLESVAKVFNNPDVDSCYGDLEYVDRNNAEKKVRCWKAGHYGQKNWYRGWMPPHPTFFVRRSIYEKYGLYRLDMGTAADYELMLRFLLKKQISTVYIPKILVKMRTGGVSNKSLRNRIEANIMDRKAWRINNLRPYPWTLLMKPLLKIPQFL